MVRHFHRLALLSYVTETISAPPFVACSIVPRLAGDYERAVEASNSAEAITSVLYPNDNTTCES
jgi:hypothetical protein